MCFNTETPIKNVSQSLPDFHFNHPSSNENGKSLSVLFLTVMKIKASICVIKCAHEWNKTAATTTTAKRERENQEKYFDWQVAKVKLLYNYVSIRLNLFTPRRVNLFGIDGSIEVKHTHIYKAMHECVLYHLSLSQSSTNSRWPSN